MILERLKKLFFGAKRPQSPGAGSDDGAFLLNSIWSAQDSSPGFDTPTSGNGDAPAPDYDSSPDTGDSFDAGSCDSGFDGGGGDSGGGGASGDF